MKPLLLKVSTPNKMLFIKGKLSRTPLETIIKSEEELNLLKSSMHNQSINFTIENYVRPVKKIIPKVVTHVKKSTPKKKTEPKTILEKIAVDEEEKTE